MEEPSVQTGLLLTQCSKYLMLGGTGVRCHWPLTKVCCTMMLTTGAFAGTAIGTWRQDAFRKDVLLWTAAVACGTLGLIARTVGWVQGRRQCPEASWRFGSS